MKRITHVLLVATALAGASASAAQTRTPEAPVPLTIIVTQPEDLARSGNIVEFTAKLLELRLVQFARVSRAQEEPPCVVTPEESLNSRGRAPLDSRAPRPRVDQYTLLVSLNNEKATGSGADVRMDYGLTRFLPTCERTELLQRSETFAESELLEVLTLAAEIVALRLESVAVSLPVVELSLKVGGSTLEQSPIAQGLVERILRDLARSGEVTARIAGTGSGGPADYSIDGGLDVTPSTVTARFTVRPQSQGAIQLPAIEGRRNNQPAFFESASKSVVALIDDLRYSRAAGLTTTRLADLPPQELRSRAMSLLCLPAPQRGCVQQPQEAEPVLARLVEKTKTAEVYEWLGIAQTGQGKHVAAADSFRLSLGASRDAATRTRVMRQLADSLYESKQFDLAAAQYDDAYRPALGAPSDSETYVRWARSHRLGKNGALRAAEVLIAGLANPNLPPLPLQAEFRDVVATERAPALTSIYARLRGAGSTGTEPLLDVVRRALARAHLADAEAAHGKRDFKTMDAALTQAETLANDLTADTGAREAMARLRGLWFRDRAATSSNSIADDFRQAETYLRQALSWDPNSSRTQFALAATYSVWPGEEQKPGPHTQQAVNLFRSLTIDHFPTAAENLVRLNRLLMRNEDTRAALEAAVKDNPMDRWALDALMDVCTDSLFAYECAADAAEKLDALEGSSKDIASQLEISEIEVLAGRRAAASARLDRIMANSTTLDPFRNVALFYQIWLKFQEDPTNDPTDLLQSWQAAVKKAVTMWTFDGANHVLTTTPPFGPQRAQRLLGMIKQMQQR